MWTHFRFQERHRKTPILQLQGCLVQYLTCDFVDKDTIKTITQYCKSLRSLSLRLNLNAFYVHYDVLEALFIGLRNTLTRVHVRFDASIFSPTILWSLSQLPNLVELHLDPYHSTIFEGKYRSPEEYLGILRVCTNLQSFVSSGCFLKDTPYLAKADTKESLPRWWKKIMRPKGDRTPANLVAAMARRVPTRSSSQSRVNPEGAPVASRMALPPPLPSFDNGLTLRRINVHSGPHSVHTLKRLFELSPLLEEVIVARLSGSFTLDCWKTLAKSCPRIRLIRLDDNIMAANALPALTTVFTDFPQLESLELINFHFGKDPDLAALSLHLRQLEKQHDENMHPLKRLHFTGAIEHPVKVLLDALSLESSSIESLTVGKTTTQFRPDSTSHTATTTATSAPTLDLTAPWTCLSNLAHLDIAKVPFPDNISLHQFFAQLERSNCLRSLGVAPSHLRDLYVNSMSGEGHIDHRTPPTLSIVLPTVHTVSIDCSVSGKDTYMYHEFDALLAAVPCLKRVGFHPSIGEAGFLKRLTREHPSITFISLTPLQGSL